jgi:hypothetical protein
MTVFYTLTERQQQGLTGDKVDRTTRKALHSRGLITSCDDSGFQLVTLTDAGQFVLFEHTQRDNRLTDFKRGDAVVHLWGRWRNGRFIPGARRATVVYLTTAMVCIEYDNEMRATLRPASLAQLADFEAAGLGHLVQS